jgi:hypothetical protein
MPLDRGSKIETTQAIRRRIATRKDCSDDSIVPTQAKRELTVLPRIQLYGKYMLKARL